MALRVKSEADLAPNVLEAIRRQEAAASPSAARDVSHSAVVEGDGWGWGRTLGTMWWGWLAVLAVLTALRAVVG